MVPLDLFSLVGAGMCKPSFMCHSTMLVELTKVCFVSVEWTASFKKNGAGVEVLRKVPNNGVFKARP